MISVVNYPRICWYIICSKTKLVISKLEQMFVRRKIHFFLTMGGTAAPMSSFRYFPTGSTDLQPRKHSLLNIVKKKTYRVYMFKKTQYVQSFKDLKSEREFYGISKKGFIFVF